MSFVTIECAKEAEICISTARVQKGPGMILVRHLSYNAVYLTIRLRARVFYEQTVNEAQPSRLSLVENEGE